MAEDHRGDAALGGPRDGGTYGAPEGRADARRREYGGDAGSGSSQGRPPRPPGPPGRDADPAPAAGAVVPGPEPVVPDPERDPDLVPDGGEVPDAGACGAQPPPAPRQVLADSVYEAVKTMVMDHEIQPGARVGIEALARTLDVSPTPVREALARLESDGLVTKRSLAGYRATELLTRQGLDELFEMRLLLEPRAAALAAVNADDDGLDAIEALVEEMRGHAGAGGRHAVHRDFAGLDQRFHEAVARAAGRRLLAEAVGRLHSHLHVFRLGSVPGAGPLTLAEHERILRAILRRNPGRADEAMRDHLTRSLARRHTRGLPEA